VASAFSLPIVKSQQNNKTESTMKEKEDSSCISNNFSPGKKIDYQAKLLSQIDLAHQIFEHGAITTEQFEKQREILLESLC